MPKDERGKSQAYGFLTIRQDQIWETSSYKEEERKYENK